VGKEDAMMRRVHRPTAAGLLGPRESAALLTLPRWVRAFTIMYGALWLTLTLAFFALLLALHARG
jgi:hypothetical protein